MSTAARRSAAPKVKVASAIAKSAIAIGKDASPPEKGGDNVRAVDRALAVLLAFTPQDHELTVAALMKRVDLSRPTLYRLLYTLEQNGFLVAAGEPQRFRLGPSVARLAHVWTSSLDLAVIADPVMRRIWTASGETVAVFVPQGALRRCVAEIPSLQPLSFKRGIGYTERIALGATGRAILAHLAVGDAELRTYTRGTKLDFDELRRELERTRKRGYAMSRNELIEGAVAVAAPLFDRHGAIAGSIGIFAPATRMTERVVAARARELMAGALELSHTLGAPA
ncbi:MAG: IclR family transcriptional regulator [Caldimonas sp.]